MKTPASHPREEEAAAFAFGLMDAAERIDFVNAMNEDAELRAIVDDLQAAAAVSTLATAQVTPPPAVRGLVLQNIKSITQDGAKRSSVTPPTIKRAPVRYALAAAALVLITPTVLLWKALETTKQEISQTRALLQESDRRYQKAMAEAERSASQLQTQLAESAKATEALKQELAHRTEIADDLKQELAKAIQAHDSAKTQIAMLQSTVAEYKQGVAVVVWNPEKQEGILKLEKMPPVETGKDYQLWVVDPAHKTPVNAGIVKVDDKGFAKVDFKPVVDITDAKNFAISIEQAGGVPENKGPIVLLSP